jgi:Family of unknown function (DUF6361)
MKPILGWTMLSREEMRMVERSLANSEQDTRDEIGFLLVHQGFADRFFPGTSVLHTRIRYALFVPWLYLQAASSRRRGSDLDAPVRRLLIQLAIRLKQLGGEPFGVIGGDKLGQLTSQPPDRVYWTALRTWGLLLPTVDSRSEVLRRLQYIARPATLDDDGGRLDDESTETFAGLAAPPAGWDDFDSPLRFEMPPNEREFLRRKLSLVTRSGEDVPSLLARLVEAGDSFKNISALLPEELDARADAVDRQALDVARDAAALAAIGRAVYGALVEQLRARDGGPDEGIFRLRLQTHFATYGEAAGHCDLDAAETLIPELPQHVRDVLRKTREYVRESKPERYSQLRDCYQRAERIRKTAGRARLLDTERSAQRRAEWDPGRHSTKPLHYRWHIVREMLADLSGS